MFSPVTFEYEINYDIMSVELTGGGRRIITRRTRVEYFFFVSRKPVVIRITHNIADGAMSPRS